MSEDDDALDADMLSVLRSAKPVTVTAAAQARVLANVDARVGGIGGGGSGGGGGPSGSEAAARLGGAAKAGFVAAHPLLALGAALVVGGAIGAFARGAAAPSVVYVDRVVAAPVPAATVVAPVASAAPRDVPAAVAPPEEVASAKPRASAAPLDSAASLAAESALLDVARTALARGESDHALAATARHAAQFPNGALREEREALTVKALAMAGRGSEATARADRFRSRYPESLFSTAIDSSLSPTSGGFAPRHPPHCASRASVSRRPLIPA